MYNAITNAEIQVDQPIKQELMQKIKDNFDDHQTRVGSLSQIGIPNGSFEIDSDSDDKPDTWTINTYSGGVAGLSPSTVLGTDGQNYTCIADHASTDADKPVTGANWATYWAQKGQNSAEWQTGKAYKSSHAHGAKCIYFIHPGGAGNGGGYADSDYIECDALQTKVLSFINWASTSSSLKVEVYARYFDKDKIYLSETSLHRTTTPSTSATQYRYKFTPPANARFVRIRITGGAQSSISGEYPSSMQTVYFDAVKVESGTIIRIPALAPYCKFLQWAASGVFGWTDRSNSGIYILHNAIRLNIEVRVGANSSGAQGRLRIGTVYGDAISIYTDVSGNLQTKILTMNLQGVLPGDNTVYWQAMTPGGSIRGYKNNDDFTIESPPSWFEQRTWFDYAV